MPATVRKGPSLYDHVVKSDLVALGNQVVSLVPGHLRVVAHDLSQHTDPGLVLPLGGATFFLVQTLPVVTVIALTEGGTMLRIWSGIVHLAFPYYVLSAGVASIVTTASQHWGWQIPLLVLPVMYGVLPVVPALLRSARDFSSSFRLGEGGGIQLSCEPGFPF